MPVICQRVLGAGQFIGSGSDGLFRFSRYDNLPRTTGIQIVAISYIETAPGATTIVGAYAQRSPLDPLEQIPLGVGDATENLISPLTGRPEAKFCGILLPREPGDGAKFWDITVITTGKTGDGVACVEWVTCPIPETNERDSLK